MKSLDEIMVSETKLNLLAGGKGSVFFQFPKVKNKKGKERKEQVSIQAIINHSEQRSDKYGTLNTVGKVKSFDARFDGKHPLILAIDKIREDGIRKSILTSIYTDNKCIQAGRLVGNYSVFNDILMDEQRWYIENKLVKIREFKEGEKERVEKFFK
jgi:hypothetical protein